MKHGQPLNPRTSLGSQALPDVQASSDARRVGIDKVGVKDVRYPITLQMPGGQTQTTVATISMYVALPPERKGTHMSRFLEVLNDHGEAICSMRVIEMCRELRDRLDAPDAHVEMEFPYFIRKQAPVTQAPGLVDYKVRFQCCVDEQADFVLGVTAPATSLCPCSREISDYGAHNQRCEISAEVRFQGMLWIEDLVEILEGAASAPVFSVVKRPDEKFLTEQAFDNPRFVEDIIRELALALDADDRITWYRIHSLNYESIHSHNAYAQITRDKREG